MKYQQEKRLNEENEFLICIDAYCCFCCCIFIFALSFISVYLYYTFFDK